MARRRGFTRFVRPAPKTKIWIGWTIATTQITADASTLVSTLNAAALAFRPFTILRTRAILNVATDQTAASEFPKGALGKMVVSEEAATAGSASIPDPVADSDGDWYVWQPFEADFVLGAAAVGFYNIGWQYTIDSKAMRKVGNNKQVITMIEEVNAFGVDISVAGRMLIQLH